MELMRALMRHIIDATQSSEPALHVRITRVAITNTDAQATS